MSDLVLSRDEVRDLTRSPQRVKQVAFLRANGIRHYVDAHGWPVVLRATVAGDAGAAQVAKPWKSNKVA